MAKLITPPAPEVVNSYGLPIPSWAKDQPESDHLKIRLQFYFDKVAFSTRRTWHDMPTRPELFMRIADTMVPGWFEWHAWTNRIVEALCRYRWVGILGCSNCVSGHTRILDPITGEQPTIKELCEKGIAPDVMTSQGAIRADVPFIKGFEDMYEIILEDGQKLTCTAGHRVCVGRANANHWSRVGDLRCGESLVSYEPNHQGSILEPAHSNRQQGALCFQRKAVSSQYDYHSSRRFCGDKLPAARGIFQSIFPSQVGALKRIQGGSCMDGLGYGYKHIPCSFEFDPLSICHDLIPPFFYEEHQSLPVLEKHVGGDHQHQLYGQSPFCTFPALSVPESDPDYDSKRTVEFLDEWSSLFVATKIVTIRAVGKQIVYDISVPGPQNYVAEGFLNHNSAKTFNVASFAALWWLMDPDNTSVFFCSTTSKMLKKRGWSEIQKINQAIGGFGNFVNSQTVWQSSQGDDRHAIFGKAVADGDTAKAAADIQGVHTKRQMLVLDEAEAISPAIWTAAKNLYAYPDDVGGEFLMVAMANPRSRLSQFGRFIEPEGGYDTVSVETEEWVGKPQIDGRKTCVIRFDFLKSPNMLEGREVSKHLPKKSRIQAQMTTLKLTGGENNPDFWCYSRGFPPPEGLSNTVFTDSLLNMHDAYGRHQFTGGNFRIIGALDPAYGGGDRPALRFAAFGEIAGNKMGIEWMYPIVLGIDVTSKDPVRYQLVNQCQKHCANVEYRGQRYVCKPEDFGIDTTGDAGTADIAQREWSPKIIRICFSESPSEEPISAEDERLAVDVYLNKRVEMYYRTRNGVMSGQIKGVDKDTASELCTLEEMVQKKDGTVVSKVRIQSKKEYKLKYQKSPDYADCGVEITEVARIKGFIIAAVGLTITREGSLSEMTRLANAVYEDISYSRENFYEALLPDS